MELKREQIEAANRRFAKLLGWYQIDKQEGSWYENQDFAAYVAYSIHNNYPHRDLPFHRDWNYLMKVIDKIGQIHFHRDGDAPDWNWKHHYTVSDVLGIIWMKWVRDHDAQKAFGFNLMNDVESTWACCVAWLDWYENKDEDEI